MGVEIDQQLVWFSRPKLRRQLRPGARVVSHAHHMGDWVPERVDRVTARSGETHTLYLCRIGR